MANPGDASIHLDLAVVDVDAVRLAIREAVESEVRRRDWILVAAFFFGGLAGVFAAFASTWLR